MGHFRHVICQRLDIPGFRPATAVLHVAEGMASIIYFGDESSEEWIRTKLQDLLKAPGFGRVKPLLAKAVYFTGNKEIDKEHYEKNNAMVLGNNGNFAPDHLKPFLTKMESK